MNRQFIYWLSDKVAQAPSHLSRGRDQKEAILCPPSVQAGGMLVIRGILAWGRQGDMTQIHKCTINLPFIQNVCFIVVSWPIGALKKYITYLDFAFRPGAGVCPEGQIFLLFPRASKEHRIQISILPDSPATSHVENNNRGWCSLGPERENTAPSQWSEFLIFFKQAATPRCHPDTPPPGTHQWSCNSQGSVMC